MGSTDPRLLESAHDKTLTMERSVALIRAMVIGLNIAAWFLFLGFSSPRAPFAFSIIVIAATYAVWSWFARPYERYPLFRFGAATLATDAALITAWVLATGGSDSEFWVIYIISVISVAMRYDLSATVATAFAEATLAAVVLAASGSGWSTGLLIRPGYIVIAGVAAGMLARQERVARHERVASERLAAMRAELLEQEHRTVQRLQELDRMKTEFIAHASHELRTPLTTLAGLATTMARRGADLTPDQMRAVLEAMERQGERTKSLIENLLDLSQLDDGSMRFEIQPVAVRSALAEALALAPPPAEHIVDLDLRDDGSVLADRRRLGQVLSSLLRNAYHYGGSHIRWEATRRNGDLLLSIVDDGDGIPIELEGELFQPFHRGTNVGDQTGSGLGLAVARRVVTACGGDLTYERARPKGARFTVKLPAA